MHTGRLLPVPRSAVPAALACAVALALALRPAAARAADAPDSLLSAPRLDLALLERAVLRRNPSLAAAAAAWQAARARSRGEGSVGGPRLDLSLAPGSLGSDLGAAYRVGVGQDLALFGRRGLAREAAGADSRAAGDDYRTAALDLLREARSAYFDAYLAERALEVIREQSDLVDQLRRTALAKYSAGTSSLQDALQAEAEAAMLDHQRVALERERREVGIRINALLWLPPATVLPPPPSELAMPAPPDSSGSLDSLRAQAERARPEVRAAQAAVDAARARLELARRGRLPEVMVEGAFDRFMDRSETRATLGVGMSLPFLSGLSGAAADAASAELAGARHRLDAARNRVGLEVGDALARLAEAHHEVEVMGASVVPTTEQALRAVRANYEANRTDFVVLLNSERDFASARLDYFRALADYGQAHTDLDRAVGLLPPGIPGGGNRDE